MYLRDFEVKNSNKTVNYFGIELNVNQYQRLKKKLDKLNSQLGKNAKTKLHFKRFNSVIKGVINIRTPKKTFIANKTAITPYQTYLLLEEDIMKQLLNWKRDEFSQNLYKNIS